MAKLKITEYPHPVLARRGAPVTKFDAELAQLAAAMFETMYAAEGVGLAAQQVGLALRFFVMDCDGIKLEAANPEILSVAGTATGEEGCLSVGALRAVLQRPAQATLRAQNLQGEWFEHTAEGLAARCLLHETDHCDGKLFISHLPHLRREMLLKRFRKDKKFRQR